MAERTMVIKTVVENGQAVEKVEELGEAIQDVAEEAKKTEKATQKAMDKAAKEAEKAAKETEQAFNQAQDKVSSAVDVFTGGLFGQFKAMKEGIQATFPAFKGLRGAILATGLGALIVLVGELVANFEDISNWFTGVTGRVNALEKENKQLEKRGAMLDEQLIALQGQENALNKIFQINQEKIKNELKILQNQKDIARELGDQDKLDESIVAFEQKRLELAKLIKEEEIRRTELLNEARYLTDEAYKQERDQYNIGKKFRDEQKVTAERLKELNEERRKTQERVNELTEFKNHLDEKGVTMAQQEQNELAKGEARLKELGIEITELLNDQILLRKAITAEEKASEEANKNTANSTAKQVTELDRLLKLRQSLNALQKLEPTVIESGIEGAAAPEVIEAMNTTDDLRAEWERRLEIEREIEAQRVEAKKQALDGIVSIFGAETKAGRAALIARQVIAAQELIAEARRTITFSTLKASESQVAVAAGAAKTASVGFPQNIPLLAAYAVQAGGIIASIASAVRNAGGVADGGGVSFGGGGGNSFGGGQAPNPASAVDLNFLNQQPPVQAYVLQDDLKSNAEASQRIRDLASL